MDLHLNHSGLYLLPYVLTFTGSVEEVCAFGIPNFDDQHDVSDDATDFLEPVFIYVLHYQLVDGGPQNVFKITNEPVIVHHTTAPGCTEFNELHWQVTKGDRIGIFIPHGCTSVANLLNVTSAGIPDIGAEDIVCPTQVDVIVENDTMEFYEVENQCIQAYYLNSSLTEIAEIRLEEFILLEQTHLSVHVAIHEHTVFEGIPVR